MHKSAHRPIHISSINTYYTCPRQYFYEYVERIKPVATEDSNITTRITRSPEGEKIERIRVEAQSKKTSARLVGSYGHEILKHWYNNNTMKESIQSFLDKTKLDLTQPVQDLIKVMHAYSIEYSSDKNKYTVLMTEIPIQVDHYNEYDKETYKIRFTIDALLQCNESGHIFIMDHKILSQLNNTVPYEFTDQFIGYHYFASRELPEYKVKGTILNAISKSIPATLDDVILTSGKLSTNKTNNITYNMFMYYLTHCKLDPDDYKNYIEFLQTIPNKLFKREIYPYNSQLLYKWRKNFDYKLNRIRHSPMFEPNVGYTSCRDCLFQDICFAEQIGANWESYIGTMYTRKSDDER